MVKKVLLIIAHPFYLLYLVASFPFKIAHIVIKDKKDNRKKKKKTKFDIDVNYLYIGELLFADCKNEFKEFYNLYSTDKKQHDTKYQLNLQDRNGDLKPIEMVQTFGDYKKKVGIIDWKGEENINEIENFIELQITPKVVWTHTTALRTFLRDSEQQDGKFIIKLFQSIDKDLKNINYRLLFFEMGWDAYVYIPVPTTTFDKVLENAPNDFQIADDL